MNLHRTLREVKTSLNSLQKDFKSLKASFDNIKDQSTNNISESNDSQTVTPIIAGNKVANSTSEIEDRRKIVEENVALTRENLELKDCLNIMKRLLNQVLRDQEEKRKLLNEQHNDFTLPSRSTRTETEQKGLHSGKTYVPRNIYKVLTEPESERTDEDSESEYCQFRY